MTRVPLRSIYLRRRLDPMDRKKVTLYRQALRRGDVFPPIDVHKFRVGYYEVMDGYHRFHAHRLEGRKTILIYVKAGIR
jgi:uncharacterized ParB-like nuclease family protein